MKSRTCKYVSEQRKHCLCCISSGRDYSQGIDLCLNEGDEVVDCGFIIICEHEIAVGIMRTIG